MENKSTIARTFTFMGNDFAFFLKKIAPWRHDLTGRPNRGGAEAWPLESQLLTGSTAVAGVSDGA